MGTDRDRMDRFGDPAVNREKKVNPDTIELAYIMAIGAIVAIYWGLLALL